MNSTWLITSELANQRTRKVLFTCVVYTNSAYCFIWIQFLGGVEGGWKVVSWSPTGVYFTKKKTIKVAMMPYHCTCCRSVVDRIAKLSTFFLNYLLSVMVNVKRIEALKQKAMRRRRKRWRITCWGKEGTKVCSVLHRKFCFGFRTCGQVVFSGICCWKYIYLEGWAFACDKLLMSDPKENSEFCFPETLNVPRSGKAAWKHYLFTVGQSLRFFCYISQLQIGKKPKIGRLAWHRLVTRLAVLLIWSGKDKNRARESAQIYRGFKVHNWSRESRKIRLLFPWE